MALPAADTSQPEPEPEPSDGVVLIPPTPKAAQQEEDELFGDDGRPEEEMAMDKEDDEGNVEYKLQLLNPSPERFVHLVTQCQFRVSEGKRAFSPVSSRSPRPETHQHTRQLDGRSSDAHVRVWAAGHGEAIYQIGVEDDGTVRGITQEQLDASVETLKLMAAEIDADATLIRERDGLSCAALSTRPTAACSLPILPRIHCPAAVRLS